MIAWPFIFTGHCGTKEKLMSCNYRVSDLCDKAPTVFGSISTVSPASPAQHSIVGTVDKNLH